MEYRFEIVSLLVSPRHAYFGRPKDGPADEVETTSPEFVDIVADKGIRGDRFYGVRAHTEAAVTFLAIEAWQSAAGDADPALARRNVVVRGLELDPLRGREFSIDTGDGPVTIRGGRPAHPCTWMDTVAGEGTRKALIGRGGGLKGNQHLRYAQNTPLANLLVTMLDRAGVPANELEKFGDATGPFSEV